MFRVLLDCAAGRRSVNVSERRPDTHPVDLALDCSVLERKSASLPIAPYYQLYRKAWKAFPPQLIRSDPSILLPVACLKRLYVAFHLAIRPSMLPTSPLEAQSEVHRPLHQHGELDLQSNEALQLLDVVWRASADHGLSTASVLKFVNADPPLLDDELCQLFDNIFAVLGDS